MARQKIVVGNWTMNGSVTSIELLNSGLLSAMDKADFAEDSLAAQVVVAPPFPYLSMVRALLADKPVQLAAQNVSSQPNGAFTGEVSIAMLQEFDVEYVLAGHSERRTLYNETNEDIADKVSAILAAGLTAILCVGETLEQRQQGITTEVCKSQVDSVVQKVGIEAFGRIIIAYEPVWAIGTGLSATAEQAQTVHAAIRQNLAGMDRSVSDKVRIVYGGSVKASNSNALFAMPDIDGALVGGASLDVNEFVSIIKTVG